MVRDAIAELYDLFRDLDRRIGLFDKKIDRIFHENEACQRIAKIKGIGPKTATTIVAAIGDGSEFKNGRHLAAWVGLVPRQFSSGDRKVLTGIPACPNTVRFALRADAIGLDLIGEPGWIWAEVPLDPRQNIAAGRLALITGLRRASSDRTRRGDERNTAQGPVASRATALSVMSNGDNGRAAFRSKRRPRAREARAHLSCCENPCLARGRRKSDL
jgi:hypothetical protein